MQLKLHKNATTTPATRKFIQESDLPIPELAQRLGVHETTIRRWKKRTTQHDLSHTPHKLPFKLTPVEEQLIVELRTELRLSGYDIQEVMSRCVNPEISSGMVYRCLRRNDLSKLPPLHPPEESKSFEQYDCGFIHMDIKYLTRLDGKPAYVFVAIDRATRFVYVEIHENRSGKTAAGFLERFSETFGHPIHTILTDNGGEFTDRFAVKKPGKPENAPSGEHPFDQACCRLGIRHKLIRPFRPQTNGMVERFNRRLNEALAQVPKQPTGHKHFTCHAERNAFILRFVDNYNRTRLRCLNGQTPLLALSNHTTLYTSAGTTEGVLCHSLVKR